MPSLSGVTVTIEVNGYEDAQRLALAVALLRYYATTYGDEKALQVADEAREGLENLTIDTEQRV